MKMEFEPYMRRALALAAEAAAAGEVPVGCVIVDRDGTVLGEGRNRREETRAVTGHAELMALEAACASRGDWRMDDCTAFVTLEPCPMCAGAIINARVPAVFYGAREAQSGACGSVIDLFFERFGHQPTVSAGLCGEACAGLLRDFFQRKR